MIYLIGGPPRCGKTTLAKAMLKQLRIPWISTDALEVVSRAYISKEKWRELYPYSSLRKRGNDRNNDEFYSNYLPRKIISVLKKQAKTSFKAIDMMIANEIDNGNDYIIEGYHILPSFADKLLKKYGKEKIRVIFLTKSDKEKFAKDVFKSNTPNDWLIVLTHKKETFIKVGEMVSAFSFYFEREAKKFKFNVLNMDNNFESQIKDAINYSFLSVDIKEYVEKVKDKYEKNKNQNQAGLIKNSILLLSGMILSIMLILGIYHFKFFSKASRAGANITDNKSIAASAIRVNAEEESNAHYRLEDDLDNNSEIERIEFNAYFHKDGRTTEVFINEREPLYLRGYFFDAYTKDINKDGVKEVVIESAVGANGIWTEIYTYQNGDLKNIPVRANNIFSGFLGAGIKFVDYDDDGDLEVESVHRVSDICQARSDIYEYIEGKFVKAKELIEFEETCRESMKKVTG